jgi:predicted phosphodiesterase
MRIAVLSDIHGNVFALEAALADVKRQGADVVVNAGDILSGPLEPAATADLLLSLGLPTIAGNHERQLLACASARGGASDQFAFEHTTERHRAWLRTLPPVLEIEDDVLVCHGTPSSDVVYFLEEVGPSGSRAAPPGVVEARARGVSRSLVLCGHSHKPRAAALSDGRLVVCAGSVGLQAYDDDRPHPHVHENGSPHARYVLCERGPAGWSVTFRCVPYEHGKAAAAARRHGREDWARWLETGRVA